jgi:hypothetical protein
VQDGSGDVLAAESTLVGDAILEFIPVATGSYLVGVCCQGTAKTPYSMHVTAHADGTTTFETRFNNGSMNIAIEVRALGPVQFVFEDPGETQDRNRVGGTLDATAGRQYCIDVQRDFAPDPNNATISVGPCFFAYRAARM